MFRAARLELAQRDVQPSSVFIDVGFHRADASGFATAFYYFDPYEAGITSRAVPWSESEWHRSRIDLEPPRAAYARRMVDWGRDWAPTFFAAR